MQDILSIKMNLYQVFSELIHFFLNHNCYLKVVLSLFKPMQVKLNLIFQKLNNLNQFHKKYLYFQSQTLFQINLVYHYVQNLINSQYSQFDKFN